MNDPEFKGSFKHKYYEETSIDTKTQDDRLLMRSRKPHYKRIERSLSLNFGGRVKKASRKNIQIVSLRAKVFRNINLRQIIRSKLSYSMESSQMIVIL